MAELQSVLTCQISPSRVLVRKSNATGVHLVQPPPFTGTREVQSPWGAGPGVAQLVHGGAGELLLFLIHQLPSWPDLSFVARKLPKHSLETGTKTSFATGCPAGLPLTLSHLLALLFALRCKPGVSRKRPSQLSTAQPGSATRPSPSLRSSGNGLDQAPPPPEDTPLTRPQALQEHRLPAGPGSAHHGLPTLTRPAPPLAPPLYGLLIYPASPVPRHTDDEVRPWARLLSPTLSGPKTSGPRLDKS